MRKSGIFTISIFLVISMLVSVFVSLTKINGATKDDFSGTAISLVDKNASNKTASLFLNLRNIAGKGIMFGQQHATTQGLTISKTNGTESDVLKSVGDYPAVYGWDTLSLEGREVPYSSNATADVMRMAYERNGVITLSAHFPNFMNGGLSNNRTDVVRNILPGGSHNQNFTQYLDMIADFANNLKDKNGNLIPVLFRPFHENNLNWFWWGYSMCTEGEFKSIYRYTVEYLRDQKKVRNFLYVYSPSSSFEGSEDKYLISYPGDEYVDVLAFDAYDPTTDPAWLNSVVRDAKMIVEIASKRGKISAITEIGIIDGLKVRNNPKKDWYTTFINAVKADPIARKISYMLVWRNGEVSDSDESKNHFWVPYKAHPRLGDHEMLPDFNNFYKDEYTLFNKEIPDMYSTKVTSMMKSDALNIIVPAHEQEIYKNTVIKVSAFEATKNVQSMVCNISDGTNLTLTKGNDGYYTAVWTPESSYLYKKFILNVTATYFDGSSATKNIQINTSDAPSNPTKQVGNEFVIDDFETYYFDSRLRTNFTKNILGDSLSLGITESPVGNGKFSLKCTYSVGVLNNYTGFKRDFSDTILNLSNYNNFQFWFKPDGMNQPLVIQLIANGTSFEYEIKMAGLNPMIVNIPFEKFRPAPWEANQNARLTPENLTKIAEVSFYPNASKVLGEINKVVDSVIYFDQIKATQR